MLNSSGSFLFRIRSKKNVFSYRVFICFMFGKIMCLKFYFDMVCLKSLCEKNDMKKGFCFVVIFNFIVFFFLKNKSGNRLV